VAQQVLEEKYEPVKALIVLAKSAVTCFMTK